MLDYKYNIKKTLFVLVSFVFAILLFNISNINVACVVYADECNFVSFPSDCTVKVGDGADISWQVDNADVDNYVIFYRYEDVGVKTIYGNTQDTNIKITGFDVNKKIYFSIDARQGNTVLCSSDEFYILFISDESCLLTFDANGGGGEMQSLYKLNGEEYTLPTCTFDAPNDKRFKNWIVGEEEKSAGENIVVSGDLNIKANWEDFIKTYTIYYVANGGYGVMSPITNYRGEYELPKCEFTAPNGKEFLCWSVNDKNMQVGEKIVVDDNTVITAIWQGSLDVGQTVLIIVISLVVLIGAGFGIYFTTYRN